MAKLVCIYVLLLIVFHFATGFKHPVNAFDPKWVLPSESRYRFHRSIQKTELGGISEDYILNVLYSGVSPFGDVLACFQNIPSAERKHCLEPGYAIAKRLKEGATTSVKEGCCAKWAHIECMELYTFNANYCTRRQQSRVRRFFNQIRSLQSNGSPECRDYRPILEDEDARREAKCAN